MKSFVIKCILYSIPVLGLLYLAAHYADGFTDAYYLRFTSEPQKNLIIGTSRAAQGLQPEILNPLLAEEAEEGIFNYAFTLKHSPFGQVYRESIQKKLSAEKEDGLFIISVDPWSISGRTPDPEDEERFNEWKAEVGQTDNVNSSPNLEYLMDNYPKGWFNLVLRRIRQNPSIHELHEDGWLEINIDMSEAEVKKREERKFKDYRSNMERLAPSEKRMAELERIIELLNERGDVYLVRLPVPGPMLEMEDEFMPSFEQRMEELRIKHELAYYNMTLLPDTFQYVDGNHLYRSSGRTVSRLLGEFILENRARTAQ